MSQDHAGRRSACRIAPQSPQGVLKRVIREVLDPQWAAKSAARVVVAQVEGNLAPLRAARARLLAATLDRATISYVRALATINVAILEIESRGPSAPQRSVRAV